MRARAIALALGAAAAALVRARTRRSPGALLSIFSSRPTHDDGHQRDSAKANAFDAIRLSLSVLFHLCSILLLGFFVDAKSIGLFS